MNALERLRADMKVRDERPPREPTLFHLANEEPRETVWRIDELQKYSRNEIVTLIEEHKGNCKVLKDRTGILLRDGKAVGWPLVEKAMKEIVTEFPVVIHPDQFYNQFA